MKINLKNRKVFGFSLLELSIVIVIASLLFAGVIGIVGLDQEEEALEQIKDNLDDIEKAIAVYVAKNGHLPCPASRDDAVATANFGRETDCSAAATGTVDFGSGVDEIRIGVVPTRTLNLSDATMFDSWNRRITYAVITDLAQTSALFEQYTSTSSHIIRVNDVNGNPINEPNNPPDENYVSYVLISHGEDGKGGVPFEGGTPPIACGSGDDSENCDDDNIVVDAFFNPNPSSFFNDHVRWKTRSQVAREADISITQQLGSPVLTASYSVNFTRPVGCSTGFTSSGTQIWTISFTLGNLTGNQTIFETGIGSVTAAGTHLALNGSQLSIYAGLDDTQYVATNFSGADIGKTFTALVHFDQSNNMIRLYLRETNDEFQVLTTDLVGEAIFNQPTITSGDQTGVGQVCGGATPRGGGGGTFLGTIVSSPALKQYEIPLA